MSSTDTLDLAVGPPTTCSDSGWVKLWYYFGFAILAVILFVILAHQSVTKQMGVYITNPNQVLWVKALVFFVIFWLINLFFINYYKNTDVC